MATHRRHPTGVSLACHGVMTGQKYRTDKSMTHQPLKGVCHGTVGRGVECRKKKMRIGKSEN